MPKSASVLAIAVAALAVASVVQVRSGHAQYYGDAPWCAVLQIGTGSVVWHCYYRTAAECAPQVIAGNRGTCNHNPYGAAPQSKRLKHYPG